MSARVRFLLLFVVGAFLLVSFNNTFTLLAGIALLLAGIVYGVFTIASPAFLSADDDDTGPRD
jgi:Ca2+/Na+ antiporter